MKKRRRNGLKWLVALLALLLAAVVAVILFKTNEYEAGAQFYDSLRSR